MRDVFLSFVGRRVETTALAQTYSFLFFFKYCFSFFSFAETNAKMGNGKKQSWGYSTMRMSVKPV